MNLAGSRKEVTKNALDHSRHFVSALGAGPGHLAEGKFHGLKGKVKEIAGKLSDNPKLEAEGTGEKIAGKVQEKIGQVKKVLGK
jgi:uncharacterized protein YjbJ (UPF0337 family)